MFILLLTIQFTELSGIMNQKSEMFRLYVMHHQIFFHKKLDVNKYALIYAGAQKNMGPSGVTFVIIRKDLLERSSDSLHTMLNYKTHVENNSLYNTPKYFRYLYYRIGCKVADQKWWS